MNQPDHLSRPAKTAWLRWIGTSVSLALLLWLLWRQDWEKLVLNTTSLPIEYLALAVGLVFLGQIMNSIRWMILLRAQGMGITRFRVIQLAFAGLFASNFLPTTIGGDLVRIVGVSSYAQDRVTGVASVVVDRLISVIGMFFVLPCSWPLISSIVQSGLGILGSIAFINSRFIRTIRDFATRLWEALTMWAKDPGSLLLSLITSWLGVACYFTAVWVCARGLNIEVSIFNVAGVTGLTYFLTLFPISINGYGIRELGVLALYTQLGAQPEAAAALALITRAMLLTVSLPGVIWLGSVMEQALDRFWNTSQLNGLLPWYSMS
jgi:uncharacterized membrane protein YbhN (UPF0104 family)